MTNDTESAQTAEKDVLAYHLEMEGEEPEVRTEAGWVPVSLLLAQARIGALREAYFLLEPLGYEPLRGTYPEGHIARLINEAERAIPTGQSA